VEQFGRTFTGIPDTDTMQSTPIAPNAAMKGSRYTVLMGSQPDQKAYATNFQGGVFTYFFLEGLQDSSKDTNRDDWVSAEEAFRYAGPKTEYYLTSRQNPRMYDGDPSHDILLAGESDTDPTPIGTISLTSTPSGATVYLDGVNKGVTPVMLTGIPSGNHQVKLTKSDYQDYTIDVIVTTGTTTYVSATLSLTPTPTARISGNRLIRRGISSRTPVWRR
ncbi:MAG TPA: PEGA domain-containing protein, partial [Methanoregulaceae archaeon]|nr:PEGA domain-containing protein [Methanoregulaceae archaeon]